jgi:hypothetical protein
MGRVINREKFGIFPWKKKLEIITVLNVHVM